ncbi:MAG: tetratricopeptide repeat protein [Nitrospiraceae bacterium]|nr:MAG: tetratricopeptide repeat protein [Nitrospiraceae bacterium]
MHTIQTASFTNEAPARRHYESVKQKLRGNERDHLRIEKVGRYYAVRVGRFENLSNAQAFYRKIEPELPSAIIMKAQSNKEQIAGLSSDADSAISGYPGTLHRAREMVREGHNREALALLLPYTKDAAQYPEAVSDYIVTAIWSGKEEEALEMYGNLPDSFPKRAYLMRNVAKVYYDRADFQKSLTLYQAAIGNAPDDEEAQKGVVYSLTALGEYERAVTSANDFLSRSPHSFELALARADLFIRVNRYADALRAYWSLAQGDESDTESVFQHRDAMFSSIPSEKRRDVVSDLQRAAQAERELMSDYVAVLILYRDFDLAVREIEVAGLDSSEYSPDMQLRIAWAYFQTDEREKARNIYREILDNDSHNDMARIGLSYCLAKDGKGEEALRILDVAARNSQYSQEVMFARAYAFEQTGRFWSAVEEYDRILEINPESTAAKRLRLVAMSDMGASTHADTMAETELPGDGRLRETFHGDMAADRIAWKEFSAALDMLRGPVEDKKNLRARYDYILALVENYDMQEAVDEYERFINEDIHPPDWVLENVASAYLYLEQPDRALEIYEDVLSRNPASYNSRTGMFYVLQELRKWEDARVFLDDVDSDEPAFFQQGRKRVPNWKKMDLALDRGWSLAYEDRLGEAEEYFRDLHEKAPAHTGIRTGLAQTYLWRGWPRRALEEFKIVENLDPKDKSGKTGKIQALNELAFKEDAREEAAALLVLHQKDKHVQSAARELELEDMRRLEADFLIGGDDDGFEEVMGRVQFTQPVSLYTGLYGFVLWSESSDDDNQSKFRRAGAGAEHIVNSDLRLRQHFSINYDDAQDFGSYSEISYAPDDYWEIAMSYDSFTTDIPLRARVFGIEADKLNLNVAYVESEWRTYHLSLVRQRYSDANERYQGMLGYEQNLWVRNNWRERIFIDFYTSRNSRDDAPYFNPDHDYSASVTHMTEHTVRRIYRTAFVYRIYLSAGGYKQSGYSLGPTASLRYEHDIELSDTHALLYGAMVGSHPYDGESVTSYGFYLTWRLLF